MKKLLFLLAGALGVSTADAQYYNGSELSLRLADNSPFVMTFDQMNYTTPSNTYQVREIQPGRHHVRVSRMQLLPWGGYAAPMQVFDGFVNIPASSRVTANINQYGQYNVENVLAMTGWGNGNNGWGNGNNGWGNGNNGWGNGNNGWGNGNNGWGNGNNGCGNGNNGYGNNGWGYGNNGYGNGNNGWGYGNNGYGNNGWGYGNIGMSPNDFAALKTSIEQKSFESSKLAVAKQALSANHLSAQQVTDLVKLFDYESTKLEFAKYAYDYCVDKQNYHLVSNAFDYDSSTTDLASYINSHG